MIKIATLKELPQVYQVMGYGFNWSDSFIKEKSKADKLPENEVYVIDEDNGIVKSVVAIIDYNVNFEGEVVKFGGMAGAATLPEYRDQGNLRAIFEYSLQYMKEHNIILSGLGPFAYEYYRKFGYEWTYTWQIVTLSLKSLKKFEKADKYVRFRKEDSHITEAFRNEYCKYINGSIIDTDSMIEEKWNGYENRNAYVYGAYKDDKLVSYMVYTIKDRRIYVSEMYFINEKARGYLLHFLSKHTSNLEDVELILLASDGIRNVIDTPRVSYSNWPNKAGRVVDVLKALNMIRTKHNFKGSFTIKVDDSSAPFNEGIYQISCKDNRLNAKIVNKRKADYEISINRLSQLIFGHLCAQEAIKLDLVKINNEKAQFLEAFNKKDTMIWREF